MLSCQAGFINSGGFLSCHRFVTHTTGFATQFGTEFAQSKWLDAAGMLTVPAFFLAGTMISAFFVDRKVANNKKANYSFLFGFISFLLVVVSIFGHWGFFGHFGNALDIKADYFLLATLCLVSGIQNAAITTATGAVIRTTHMTGLTTDLGIGLVRSMTNLRTHAHELQANRIRASLIIGFIVGSTLGAYSFFSFNYLGFLIPATASMGLAILGMHK